MSEVEPLSETLRVGLLLEAAQAQQRLGAEAIEALREHLRTLDALVRAEVSSAARESLEGLSAEAQQTAATLRRARRAAQVRPIVWSIAACALSAAIALPVVRALLPSRGQIAALRSRRALFSADIKRLREYGGAVDLRRCGQQGRLCVRVDRSGPAYGAHGNFLLVKAP